MAVILVSACLIGCPCRYDGEACECAVLNEIAKSNTLVPICPEQLGGLPTPRLPSERWGDKILMKDGTDVTLQYRRGAETALKIALTCGADFAVLKAKSPSCGKGSIYDGSFSGTLTAGNGVAAEKLMHNGISVFSENELPKIISLCSH